MFRSDHLVVSLEVIENNSITYMSAYKLHYFKE